MNDMMRKPNFFIIGAPKCGTTSLASWLAEHPQVYFSPMKEPNHFDIDHCLVGIKDRKKYERLFQGATPHHRAIGEGSALYLYSHKAVSIIEDYTDNKAKYIVCLRSPVEMAYSMHDQNYYSGDENVEDFYRAWQLSGARANRDKISSWCREPKFLVYNEICLLGRQLERLYQNVPRERVHTILLDDIKNDPASAYQNVLDFLCLSSEKRTDFKVANAAKKARLRVVNYIPNFLQIIKDKIGIERNLGIDETIFKINAKTRPRKVLDKDVRKELEDYFRADIFLLQKILNRDFSAWFECD